MDVAVGVIRTHSNKDRQKVIGASCWFGPSLRVCALMDVVQRFCRGVIMWKALQHPNVLRLIGVTMSKTQFAMVSDWMANGNIDGFLMAHPDADRLELVGFLPKVAPSSYQVYWHSDDLSSLHRQDL